VSGEQPPPRPVRRRVTVDAVVMVEPTRDQLDQAVAFAAVIAGLQGALAKALRDEAGLMAIEYPLVRFTVRTEPMDDGEPT
jgi:hypothetical protein